MGFIIQCNTNSSSLFNMLNVPLSQFIRRCRCKCFFCAVCVATQDAHIPCQFTTLIQSGASKRTIVKTPCCEKYAWKIRKITVQRGKSPSGHLQEINSMLSILRQHICNSANKFFLFNCSFSNRPFPPPPQPCTKNGVVLSSVVCMHSILCFNLYNSTI